MITALVTGAVLLDILTGMIQAKINGRINSFSGYCGIWKKLSELIALFFGFFLDIAQVYLQQLWLEDAVIWKRIPLGLIFGCYILLCESISICENLYLSGVHMPQMVVRALKVAKNKIDSAGDDSDQQKLP